MSTDTKDMIPVAASEPEGRVLIPGFEVARDVTYKKNDDGNPNSAAEYQNEDPHGGITLAEARYAFFEGSEDFRKMIKQNIGTWYWTSTWLRNGEEVIERPEHVFYDKERKVWVADRGIGTWLGFEIPENGWVLEYDTITGIPKRTTSRKEEAQEVFGDNASKTYINKNGLRPVFCGCGSVGGPFCVGAGCGPDGRDNGIGWRSHRRQEQDAEHLATPQIYTLSGAEVDELHILQEQLKAQPEEISELMKKQEEERNAAEARINEILATVRVVR